MIPDSFDDDERENSTSPRSKIPSFIRRWMPNASEEELIEATENFGKYVAIVIRVYERRARENSEPQVQ